MKSWSLFSNPTVRSISVVLLFCGLVLPFTQARAAGNDPDSPEGISARFFTGVAAFDNFGVAVSSAGDVNGDGFDDVIVGANLNDAAGNNAGRAYIYFGGVIIDNVFDVKLTAAAALDNFGFSVSSAGDVNGDGYGDVIVGANLNDAGGTNSGRAYIYFGGRTMNNVSDVLLTGAAPSDNFGISVSSAGDVNGDGYSDVIVGANLNDAAGSNAGRAYIYFGGPTMDNVADLTLTGAVAGDNFGRSVSYAGDLNGDGYGDVIVGANLNDAAGSNSGRAYVYFGSASMDNIADVILTGAAAADNFGISVFAAGDVNGDSYGDVVVGAYLNDAGGTDAGRAYVFFGGAGMDNVADVTLTGAAASDNLGLSVSTAGDLNGDGYADVAVGTNLNDATGPDAGRAYVYFGGASMDNFADVTLSGVASADNFGRAVSPAGDVNGDGYGDLLVGANLNDAGGTDAGRAYLYLNSLKGTDLPDEFFTGAAAYNGFGFSAASAGDVNGDGYGDVIVGAGGGAGGISAGHAYIYFGGPSMDNIADITLTGVAAGDNFGHSVASAGDVNGDGYGDVIVGAVLDDAGGTDAGRAYVYFGGASMDNIADVTLTGAATLDNFGFSVAGGGDVNGDGYGDVIVGADGNDAGGTDAGRAYVYFGGASMDNIADVTLTGAAASDFFGISVAGGGDVNGDGYGDVIVGAFGNDARGFSAGRGYIYFGGASMDIIADVTLTGVAANDNFGFVAGAGDVNGDGYGDVIVAAPGNDAGGTDAGRAYVYFGGASMDNIADVTLTGTAENYHSFGRFVASAGDVNGDGYGDVIVGAYLNNAGGTDAGQAYVYFGGASMDNIADVTLTGAAAGDWFGISVASGGDVNGDGYGDLIVGAPYNDAGGLDAGRAYVYRSSSPPIIPRITSVQDVPNDQGGYVTVKWIRSAYDSKEAPQITNYVLERSAPPGDPGFEWESIASIAAENNTHYSYTASTLYDSGSVTRRPFYFRVTAHTENVTEYWRSQPVSGYGVDNVAPSTPSNVRLNLLSGASVELKWNPNLIDADFDHFDVYRSDTATQAITSEMRIASTTDTSFVDLPPQGPNWYYRITSVDGFGNESVPTSLLSIAQPGTTETGVPLSFALEQNYPNPFNPSTTISYQLSTQSHVMLSVYDVLGREVATLVNEVKGSGSYDVTWDATSFASGVYLYRLSAGSFTDVKKLAVVK